VKNLEINLRGTGHEDVNWIHVAQIRVAVSYEHANEPSGATGFICLFVAYLASNDMKLSR
jgi:hypothetical protein